MTTTTLIDGRTWRKNRREYDIELPDDPFIQHLWSEFKAADTSKYASTVRVHTGEDIDGVEISHRERADNTHGLYNEIPGLKTELEDAGYTVRWKPDGRTREGHTRKALIVTGHDMLGGELPADFPQL